MSVWGDMRRRSEGIVLREEDKFYRQVFRESVEFTSLTEDEKRDVESLIQSLHDTPSWRRGIVPSSFHHSCGQMVRVSEERKSYLELFKERGLLPEKEEDWDEGIVKAIQAVRVLGEYKSAGKEIVLYINNIKDVAIEEEAPEGVLGIPYLTVVRYVYLHELMHSYFDREENDGFEHVRDLEEGLAEFGALLLLNQLVHHHPSGNEFDPAINHALMEELEWAIRHVEGKRGVLQCYARGAELFKQFRDDKEIAKKMLEAYPRQF